MRLNRSLTTKDRALIGAICQIVPEWTGDATALAHKALYQTGQAGPTVNVDLLEFAKALASEALQARAAAPRRQDKPEPTLPDYITLPDNAMQAGRIRKALNRRFSFGGRIMTLGERLAEIEPTYRSHYVRRYARRKRNGYNKELATPAHEYTVWYDRDGRETGIDIPKIVFDAMPTVLERA